MKKLTLSVLAIALTSVLSACGDSGEGEYVDGVDAPAPILTGFFGYKVENLKYRSISGSGVKYEGRTGRNGDFKYNKGDKVHFYLGDLSIAEVEGGKFVSPAMFDLAIEIMGGEIPGPEGVDLSACQVEDPIENNEKIYIDLVDGGSYINYGDDVVYKHPDETEYNAYFDEDNAGYYFEGDVYDPNDEQVELPPQCTDGFPADGITDGTKTLFSALFDANRQVDGVIIDGMYVDKDENEVVEQYLSGDKKLNESHDYLALLSTYALKNKAGLYSGDIVADEKFGANNGAECLAGEVNIAIEYVPSNFGSGSLRIDKMSTVNETVSGFESVRSRNINGNFSFVPDPYVESMDAEVPSDFTYHLSYNIFGDLIGEYIDLVSGCKGSIITSENSL